MKIFFALTIFMALFSFTAIAPMTAQAQESSARPANPGDDPNEAMGDQGAGVPNYGCPDPSKSCIARLKHGRLLDDTTFRPSSSNSSSVPGAVDGATEGTK